LQFHMDEASQKKEIESIIKVLTRELYSHDYIIGRREAKQVIKLNVKYAPQDVEQKLWECFASYQRELMLSSPYSPASALGADEKKFIDLNGAFIESSQAGFVFRTRKYVAKLSAADVGLPPSATNIFQEQVLEQGWRKI